MDLLLGDCVTRYDIVRPIYKQILFALAIGTVILMTYLISKTELPPEEVQPAFSTKDTAVPNYKIGN